ncbi:unnamed protein product [Prorocentrum cordatum]|uniref:Uncharacterized protein n=1 Tax=Prorocentrum cordatum TaxID=2364126 RepID=A0ABN9XNP1_9DINO|nr:unnamed protein product [Polarella glacialis]
MNQKGIAEMEPNTVPARIIQDGHPHRDRGTCMDEEEEEEEEEEEASTAGADVPAALSAAARRPTENLRVGPRAEAQRHQRPNRNASCAECMPRGAGHGEAAAPQEQKRVLIDLACDLEQQHTRAASAARYVGNQGAYVARELMRVACARMPAQPTPSSSVAQLEHQVRMHVTYVLYQSGIC